MFLFKHYTVSCHGKLNYGYAGNSWDFNADSQPIALPTNVKLVIYIPPGTVFDGLSGRLMQKYIHSNCRMLGSRARNVNSFLTTLRKKARLRQRDFASNAHPQRRFFLYSYDGDAGRRKLEGYPQLVGEGQEHDVYNYSLTGPSAQDRINFGNFFWGVKSFDASSATPRVERAFGNNEAIGKLATLIRDYATDTDVTYFFHLIFCRVEQLDAGARQRVDSEHQTTYLNVIRYTGLAEAGDYAWLSSD